MSESNSSQDTQDANDKKSSNGLPNVQLAGWAIAAISVIAVVYYGISYGAKAYQDLRGVLDSHGDESAYTAAIIKEMSFHAADKSGNVIKLHTDTSGDTVAVYFESDGCIGIARPGQAPSIYLPTQMNYEWSLGPSRRPTGKPPQPPRKLDGMREVPSDSVLKQAATLSPAPLIHVHLSLSAILAPDPQGSCLNPHPGNFQGSWGAANGCWAPFYRRFNDGCAHYQMYNACQGYWDPQIHWTYCNTQHHP
jgi:hypothetical protein